MRGLELKFETGTYGVEEEMRTLGIARNELSGLAVRLLSTIHSFPVPRSPFIQINLHSCGFTRTSSQDRSSLEEVLVASRLRR